MLKLAKYLKPFIGFIILSIVLLFVQAFTELSLPDYMSDIVNVGIQQSGIENAVPEAVRKSEMDKLTVFMENKASGVLENYTLIDETNEKYNDYLSKYPILKDESIYVLNDISKSKIEELNPIMGKAFTAVSGIEKLKGQGNDILPEGIEIPNDADLIDIISKLPEDQRIQLTEKMNEQFLAMGDSMLIQTSVEAIKDEYEAIGIKADKVQSNYIFKIGLYMILISLVGAVATVLVGLFAAKTGAGLARDLRKKVFTKVESFSNGEFDKFSTASLITRSTNDITQIQMIVVMLIRLIVFAPIMGIGGIVRALDKSTSMSWIIALAVIILLGLISIVFSIAIPKFKLVQKLIDKLNLVTRENLSGIMVIRAFNTQKFEENRFDNVNKELTKTNLFVNRLMVVMMPAMTLIMNGVTVLIVWVGANQIAVSSMQVGDMMAFMQYAMQIIMAFLMMSVMFIMVPRASVSAQRIVEILDTKPTIIDPKNSKHVDKTIAKGIIEFKNVCFRYSGAESDAIKNVNFTAKPGQTTAIIGSTGSGKTTLINLIPRFYDVTDGEILIDGVNIKATTQYDLRDMIGYIPQKGSLFQGTIKSNLKYADENISDAEVEEAAKIAQATDFIIEKNDKFDSAISQGGTNVSGGQKQRLSIARAIAKNPKIYIFDDSFSALDFKTDAKLRRALKPKTKESTVIIVAQRISTIMNAEQILVLDEGKIVGKGTHKELIDNCQTYREIALSQLSKEELA